MTDDHTQTSLLDGIEHDAPRAKRPRPTLDSLLRPITSPIARTVRAAWSSKVGRAAVIATAFVLIANAGVGAYLVFRPVPKPDYETGEIASLFNYTLLTEDFNRLSVDERVRLIGDLARRIGAMDGGESAAMAAFATTIRGELRDQMERNISKLGVDMIDKFASEYDADAPVADREQFLMDKAVEFQKMMETMTGRTRDLDDDQRLARMQRQAERDQEQVRSGDFGADDAAAVLVFLNDVPGQHSTMHQKVRSVVLMRDMTNVLRGKGLSD